MRVIFSYHAGQRISERVNTQVPTNREVDISSAFVHKHSYLHDRGFMVEAWASPDLDNKCVLIVNPKTRVVLTVMTTGPVVTACYGKEHYERKAA
jgi:hypothetical protein